jgi:hypothetical protein
VDAIRRREQLEQATAARAQRDREAGLRLIWLGVATFAVPFLVLFVLSLEGVDLGSLPSALGFVLFTAGVALAARGRRMRVSGAEGALAADVRAPIVYLRPFGADSTQGVKRWVSRVRVSPREGFERTYEERLARTLRKVGPFVAVGDPTERLPRLGASRVYAADEDWQETVDELTARAGVVVLHAGESEGLAWEVHHVIELDAPERAVLSLPLYAKRKEPSRQARYDAFRNRFGDAFPRPLPKTIGHCQFAYFDMDWTPLLLGERGAPLPAGDSERAQALRVLAREFRIAWGPMWLRYVVYSAVFLAALAGIEAVIL